MGGSVSPSHQCDPLQRFSRYVLFYKGKNAKRSPLLTYIVLSFPDDFSVFNGNRLTKNTAFGFVVRERDGTTTRAGNFDEAKSLVVVVVVVSSLFSTTTTTVIRTRRSTTTDYLYRRFYSICYSPLSFS